MLHVRVHPNMSSYKVLANDVFLMQISIPRFTSTHDVGVQGESENVVFRHEPKEYIAILEKWRDAGKKTPRPLRFGIKDFVDLRTEWMISPPEKIHARLLRKVNGSTASFYEEWAVQECELPAKK